jgi:hypothetical protein
LPLRGYSRGNPAIEVDPSILRRIVVDPVLALWIFDVACRINAPGVGGVIHELIAIVVLTVVADEKKRALGHIVDIIAAGVVWIVDERIAVVVDTVVAIPPWHPVKETYGRRVSGSVNEVVYKSESNPIGGCIRWKAIVTQVEFGGKHVEGRIVVTSGDRHDDCERREVDPVKDTELESLCVVRSPRRLVTR